MRHLNAISEDYFRDDEHELALTSLALALRAYTSTPQAIYGRLDDVEPGANDAEQRRRDSLKGAPYRQAAFETIIHLQHFAELILKQVLRDEHELLVVNADKDPSLLHRLLRGDPVPAAEEGRLKTIEGSDALIRVCALLDDGRLDAVRYGFLRDARPFLEKLNGLRNRLWHRGAIVLRYKALDELVAGHALPLISHVVALARYTGQETLWRYRPLACGVDPFDLIRVEMTQPNWSVKKIAFLKELARAGYRNPLGDDGWDVHENENRRGRAEMLAERPVELASVDEVRDCPVCGVRSLAIFKETEPVEDEHGDVVRIEAWTYAALCECCSLNLSASYGNPSEHGLNMIPDLWADL